MHLQKIIDNHGPELYIRKLQNNLRIHGVQYGRHLPEPDDVVAYRLAFHAPARSSELSTNGLTYGNVSSLAALFGLMWLLPAVFFSVLGSLLRNRAEGVRSYSTSFVVGTLLSLACIVTVWMSILIDQIPCFVGAANCD
jgi:hypothetical protein